MTTPQTPKKSKGHFYRTYHFRANEQDPVIDQVHSIMDQVGYNIARVAKDSGVSTGTLHNWFNGKTRRPQYATITAAVRSMGYDMSLSPTKNKANGHAWEASAPRILKRFPGATRA